MLHEVRMILGFKRKIMVVLCLYGHKYSPFLLFLCLFQSHAQGTGMEIGMETGTGENEFCFCRYSNSLFLFVSQRSLHCFYVHRTYYEGQHKTWCFGFSWAPFILINLPCKTVFQKCICNQWKMLIW